MAAFLAFSNQHLHLGTENASGLSKVSFSAFIGPTLGGLSVESIGFGWTTTWIAGINCVFVITLLISYIVKRWQKHSSQQRKSRSPLPVV
jgi:predicted lipid-binding transport protein (Tim44 family)